MSQIAKEIRKNANRCEDDLPVKTLIPTSIIMVAISLKNSVTKIFEFNRVNGNATKTDDETAESTD